MWVVALVPGLSIAGIGILAIASPESLFELFARKFPRPDRPPVPIHAVAGSPGTGLECSDRGRIAGPRRDYTANTHCGVHNRRANAE